MRGIVPQQVYPKFAAHPDRTGHTDAAAHQFDQLFGDHQADARAFLGAVFLAETVEGLKELCQFFWRQSRTAVFDADADGFRGI